MCHHRTRPCSECGDPCTGSRCRACQRRPKGAVCVHCRTYGVTRPRGLCFACYADPDVRAGYAPVGDPRFHRRGHACANAERPRPPEPTAALPGTEEKVAVLESRLAAGYALFHPDDGPDTEGG
jgi:hypothetical protein